jgi:hypothetical protein
VPSYDYQIFDVDKHVMSEDLTPKDLQMLDSTSLKCEYERNIAYDYYRKKNVGYGGAHGPRFFQSFTIIRADNQEGDCQSAQYHPQAGN